MVNLRRGGGSEGNGLRALFGQVGCCFCVERRRVMVCYLFRFVMLCYVMFSRYLACSEWLKWLARSGLFLYFKILSSTFM